MNKMIPASSGSRLVRISFQIDVRDVKTGWEEKSFSFSEIIVLHPHSNSLPYSVYMVLKLADYSQNWDHQSLETIILQNCICMFTSDVCVNTLQLRAGR